MRDQKPAKIDRFLKAYIEDLHIFRKDKYIARAKKMEVVLVTDLPDNTLGYCYEMLDRIELNAAYWLQAPDNEREELYRHEMGHCVLELDHTPPLSIMQASAVLGRLYILSYKYHTNVYFGCESGDCVDVAWNEERYK